MSETIKSFTDLAVWQEGHKLVLLIYKITGSFPKPELYGLTSQIRRAAVSITSNIAEGFFRFHYKDKLNFYYDSRGSIAEVTNQAIIAKDLKLMSEEDFKRVEELANRTSIILSGLISKTKSFSSKK